MDFEKYTDRAKGFVQAAQSLALREVTHRPPGVWKQYRICSAAYARPSRCSHRAASRNRPTTSASPSFVAGERFPVVLA